MIEVNRSPGEWRFHQAREGKDRKGDRDMGEAKEAGTPSRSISVKRFGSRVRP